MLIAAAVCPHPPVLVPGATGGPTGPEDAELTRLRQACDAAVAVLRASRPDVIVVVGGAERTTGYPPDAAGTLRDFGVPFTIGDGPPVLPLSLTIGRWLLTRTGQARSGQARTGQARLRLQAVAVSTPPDQCLSLGAELASLAPRVALLAMGDGPACRAQGVPGAEDLVADRYDERVGKSLAAADLSLLETLDPVQDGELLVAGRAAWQVLAGAARRSVLQAVLHYAAAPFEVTYLAASLWVPGLR